MKLEYFGEVAVDEVDEYIDAETPILEGGYRVELDINFEEDSADPKALEKVNQFLKELEPRLKQSMELIARDYDLGGKSETAVEFLQFHLDEFDDEETKSVFGTTDVTRDAFLKSLVPLRVGFYPDDDEQFITVDISFPDREVTDYLMSVLYDSDFGFTYISMES